MDASISPLQGNGAENKPKPKPLIVTCTSPITGHTLPMINISGYLIDRGYKVTFLGGSDFKDRIEQVGATFVCIPPFDLEKHKEERKHLKTWPEKAACASLGFCVRPMPERKKALYEALEQIKEAQPDVEIVLLTETFFLGDHPMDRGAELPRGFTRRPRVLNCHLLPYVIDSRDMAPLGFGVVPDGTDECRRLCASYWESLRTGPYGDVMALHAKMLRDLGAVDVEEKQMPLAVGCTSGDITLQMCPPSLEYDISDRHPKVRFSGYVQTRGLKKDFQYPSFWPEVTRGDRKIVVVTQGTVAREYEDLIIPTLQALTPRSDILLVAILGRRGASLPGEVAVPPNAHVIDYLPYEAILPHADLCISNAGYGGFLQCIMSGVPMVLAGETEDKPEVAARGEYAGVAINLRTATPTRDQIVQSVDEMLRDDRYKKRVMQVKQENEDMKAMDVIENAILELVEAV
ncbi:hypothetical protein E4U54_005191 [Claviceps lovelessii]|nr:hypothetical protein E4U54_005191 [Claviceps lovelessii]